MKLGSGRIALPLVGLLLMAAACGGDGTDAGDGSPSPAGADTVCASHDQNAGDLLARICSEGVIRVSTDPAYPPQSELDPTTGEYVGFDIDVANEIADRLGVRVEWETPKWGVLTAGSWNDRWDMSVGSMTPTNERQEVLTFTEPYSYVPAVVVVPQDSTVSDVATDLDGATIGVCADCTYQFFLEKSLAIRGFEFDFVIDDATVQGYDTDTTALQDLTTGRLDAVMTSITTAQAFIDDGNPAKIVGDPVFREPLAIAFDKDTELDNSSLVEAVDGIVSELHSDGTLSSFSEEWYGVDVTSAS